MSIYFRLLFASFFIESASIYLKIGPMSKDFARWTTVKEKIEIRSIAKNPKRNEIWYASIGENIGNEICGKNHLFERPVYVLERLGNGCIVIPLSTQSGNERFRYQFSSIMNWRMSSALLDQIRFISNKRFDRKLPISISLTEIQELKEKFSYLSHLTKSPTLSSGSGPVFQGKLSLSS